MELVWKNTALDLGQNGSQFGFCMRKAIFNEISANCMEEKKDSIAGRIEVELLGTAFSDNSMIAALTGLTFGIAPLFGVPVNYGTLSADIRISVYDVYNQCLKSYTYYGKDKYRVSIYNGKTERVSANDIGKDIAVRFKSDVNKDLGKLTPYLLTKVYNPMDTEAGEHILEAIYHCELGNWKKALKELDIAKSSHDINDYNHELIQSVGDIAKAGRQNEIQQRNEMWAALGVGLTMATLTTAAAVMANKPSHTLNSGTQYDDSSISGGNSSSKKENSGFSTSSTNSRNGVGSGSNKPCGVCRGTGYCRGCDGSGWVDMAHTIGCSSCKVTGKCRSCSGTGYRR